MGTTDLTQSTKIAAYYLWDFTKYDDPLNHWHCAEDIACAFESMSITDLKGVNDIIAKGVYHYDYIEFVRIIAFMIYIYTNNDDELINWFLAERLIANNAWIEAITAIAAFYAENKGDIKFQSNLRSENAKQYYKDSNNASL